MPSVRVRYQTLEFGLLDIHVRTLKDKQQFSDPLGEAEALGISSAQWSLFGVIWDSSQILAAEMAVFEIKDKRILEIGCGMALSSLLLNARHADITATDCHPEAASFLIENVRLNKGATIPFLRVDWKDLNDGLGLFDAIIGADILYEKQHSELLSQFIHRHAKPSCEVILVDPGRGHHSHFSKKMLQLGYTHHQFQPQPLETLTSLFKGKVLKYAKIAA
ncbi:MAG: histidine kinase [Gammaproteobacteria bacterium CG22_combo_CG10-13_8_21_14_all_40_8]|nr:MAG: histidine kinase [Gammaproteobacteria bacterium CG22_combo_CG10-13_8_21_14_all_40_8]